MCEALPSAHACCAMCCKIHARRCKRRPFARMSCDGVSRRSSALLLQHLKTDSYQGSSTINHASTAQTAMQGTPCTHAHTCTRALPAYSVRLAAASRPCSLASRHDMTRHRSSRLNKPSGYIRVHKRMQFAWGMRASRQHGPRTPCFSPTPLLLETRTHNPYSPLQHAWMCSPTLNRPGFPDCPLGAYMRDQPHPQKGLAGFVTPPAPRPHAAPQGPVDSGSGTTPEADNRPSLILAQVTPRNGVICQRNIDLLLGLHTNC